MIDNPQNWNQHLRVASLGSVVYGTKFGTEPGLNTQYSRSVRTGRPDPLDDTLVQVG